jgi:hypothetical protein
MPFSVSDTIYETKAHAFIIDRPLIYHSIFSLLLAIAKEMQ